MIFGNGSSAYIAGAALDCNAAKLDAKTIQIPAY